MNTDSGNAKTTAYAISVLAMLIMAAYWPVLDAGFVNFDDPSYVSANRHIAAGISADSLRWAFTSFYSYNWHPLTWISHMLDIRLFGLNPMGHHLVSLLFHIANSILLFVLFKRMTGATGRSFVLAGLFALHPLHVESVAWIAERKDVLSTFFCFLTMLSYAGYARNRQGASYICSLLLFTAGLMAKPMLVTLPFVLLLIDYWPLGRLRRDKETLSALAIEKLPFLLLAAISSIITFHAQSSGGAVHTDTPFLLNAANAAESYLRYILQMLWPAGLAVFYPLDPSRVQLWRGAVGLIVLVGVTVAALRLTRRFPYCAVGWLWYVGTLLPVIGLLKFGTHAMADRYTYIPLIGLFIVAVWGTADLAERLAAPKAALIAGTAFLLALCTLLTNLQTRIWRDSATLFSHALASTTNNWLAHRNMAETLARQGRFAEALQQITESLRIKPEPLGYVTEGGLNLELGNYSAAVTSCRNAVSLSPTHDKAWFVLGLASMALKDHATILAAYKNLEQFQSPYAARLLNELNVAGMTLPSASQ
jgi:hypothetical protein